jgi:hypothetical protein
MNTLMKNKINELHLKIHNSLKDTVADAIEIGRLLTEQKEECGHGNFIPWVESNCDFTRMTAFKYMRLFDYRDKCKSSLHLQDAYKMIENAEAQERREKEKRDTEMIMEYKRTGTKPEGWTRSHDYQYKKYYDEKERTKRIESHKQEKIKEKQQARIEHESDEDILKEAEEHLKQRQKFLDGITQGNKNQNTFFEVIDAYISQQKGDSAQMEALQNIIKYCRRRVNEYHSKQNKGVTNE